MVAADTARRLYSADVSQLHGRNLIAGEPTAEGEGRFRGHDPAAGQPLEPEFAEATAEEVARACAAAAAAAYAYAAREPEDRAAFLEAIAEEIEALGDGLIERTTAETALPAARLQGERGRTCNQLRLFAALVREGSWVDARIDHADPERKPLPKPDVRRMLVALGPVGVFGASNFPLAFSVAGGDTASALAAGCPVVVKGHPAHPGASELVAGAVIRAAQHTGQPPGVFSLLQGAGTAVGLGIVRHPAIEAVAFTGSFGGGKALFEAAAAREKPIPVFAEMGSVNPVFALPGALAARGDEIAAGLVQSVTLGAGQFCTNPGLTVTLESKATGAFISQAKTLMREAPTGTAVHAGIAKAYETALGEVAALPGVLMSARSPDASPNEATRLRAALLVTDAQSFAAHTRLGQELFGPATIAVRCSSKDEMLGIAESLHGHLTATLHATPEDLAEHADLVRALGRKVGRLVLNGFPTGVEVCAAMHHGGPWPATTDVRSTSVGTAAILRFARPLCYQGFPSEALPAELRDDNPRGLRRTVDGSLTP